jgi:hypothetical protein
MRIEPTGIVLQDVCSIQTEKCVAKQAAPITAVWTLPGRVQVNVCRSCLEEQVRSGEWEIQGARIERCADIVVYSQDNKPQLVVEVKKRRRNGVKPKAWATRIRRNLVVHSGIPSAPYFLLAVMPGHFYLWKDGDPTDPNKPPDFEINTLEALKPYFDRLSKSPDQASEYELEAVVTSWLKDIVGSKRRSGQGWLYDSGLFRVIRNGSVVMQAAVAA